MLENTTKEYSSAILKKWQSSVQDLVEYSCDDEYLEEFDKGEN